LASSAKQRSIRSDVQLAEVIGKTQFAPSPASDEDHTLRRSLDPHALDLQTVEFSLSCDGLVP
jgi:hypothetical protein